MTFRIDLEHIDPLLSDVHKVVDARESHPILHVVAVLQEGEPQLVAPGVHEAIARARRRAAHGTWRSNVQAVMNQRAGFGAVGTHADVVQRDLAWAELRTIEAQAVVEYLCVCDRRLHCNDVCSKRQSCDQREPPQICPDVKQGRATGCALVLAL
eukprot:112891-Prymnesium_polylepis.2